MKASWGTRLGVTVIALMALIAAPARAVVNPFVNDQWQGLVGLNAANNANWIHFFASSPTKPNEMWAGTQLDGVYRSEDFGVTWSALNTGLDGDYAQDVEAINLPTSPTGTVVIGTAHGLFSLQGSSWKPKAQGVEDDPKNPKNLNESISSLIGPVPGTQLAGTFTDGVYTSKDGGDTWKPPAENNGMPDNSQIRTLVKVGPLPASPVILAGTSVGVYRSTDFGATWKLASDGLPFTGVTTLWADQNNPNIAYAGTLGYGVYRTLNGGISWSTANGSGTHALKTGDDLKINTFIQFTGDKLTRIYAGTRNGVWAGETGSGPSPGAISWRRLTDTGLITPTSTNTIFWALANFVNDLPGVLIGGTQSNGGYGLQMVPPEGPPPAVATTGATINTIRTGDKLTASVTGWKGTQTLEFTWQWQRCPATGSNPSCDDIDGATGSVYSVGAADVGHRLKVNVTGRNDYPSFTKNISTRNTLLSSVITVNHDADIPVATQVRPDVPSEPSGDGIYQVGEKMTAPLATGQFTPAVPQSGKDYRWYRCPGPTAASGDDDGSADCDVAALTDTNTYTLTADDVHDYMCYKVIGTNQYGQDQTKCSGRTNDVSEPSPIAISPPAVVGGAYVGRQVSGSIGEYNWSPVNVVARRWYLCDNNTSTSSCGPPFDGTAGDKPYTPKADEKGEYIRYQVDIDTNATNKQPDAESFWSPPSAAITDPPPPPAPPFDPSDPVSNPGTGGGDSGGGGTGGGGGGDTGAQPTATPLPIAPITPVATPGPTVTPKPSLSSAKLAKTTVKRGATIEVRYTVANAGALLVEIEQKTTGHKAGKSCKSGKPKRGQHKCTYLRKLGSDSLAVRSGSNHVTFKASINGHKLKAGSYTIVVVPYASGVKGTSKQLSLKVKN